MNSEVQNNENKEKGDGGKKLIIAIGAIIVIALISAVVVLASKLSATQKTEASSQNQDIKGKAIVTAEDADEVVEELLKDPDTVVPMYYTVTQNSEWIFPNGTSPSVNAQVKNLEENETPVYFDLIVNETGEVVYSSPIIELGAGISNFTLDKPLDAGEYGCIVEYHLIDDDRNTLTTVSVGVTVIVQE